MDPALHVDTRDVRRLFRQAAKVGIPASLKATHQQIGEAVIAKVRPQLPVSAGTYAGSLRASRTSWVARVRAGGRRRAPYAPIIHWGSAYRPLSPARPQIAETADDMQGEIVRLYIDGLEAQLRRISAI